MTDLEIMYNNGRMVIHLEEFLSCRSITKMRKLLKVINQSDTPEIADQIQQHVRDRVSGIDGLAKVSANQIVRLKEEIRNIQNDVDVWKSQRDRNTKNSSPYKYYNDKLKVSREKLRTAKCSLNTVKREFNNHVKDKAFFEKLLSEVFS